MPDENERISKLEQRVGDLEYAVEILLKRLDTAEGETRFMGPLFGAVLTILTKTGVMPSSGVHEALDRMLLRAEEAQAAGNGTQGSWEHARSRIEATLRSMPKAPPEPH